jgi:hypothetical protein
MENAQAPLRLAQAGEQAAHVVELQLLGERRALLEIDQPVPPGADFGR